MMIISKISIIITGIIFLVGTASIIGVLDDRHTKLIMEAGLAIQLTLLIIYGIMYLLSRHYRSKCVTIQRYIINDKCVKGDTDIFPEALSSTNPRKRAIFNIYVEVKEFDEVPEFGIEKANICGNIKQDPGGHLINAKVGVEDGIFRFGANIIMSPNETINFRFRKDTKLGLFSVNEIYIP